MISIPKFCGAILLTIFCAGMTDAGNNSFVQVDWSRLEYLGVSDDYRVWVDGAERLVYKSRKQGQHGTNDISAMSFVGFDLDQSALVRIQPRRAFRRFALRPHSAKIDAARAQDGITFTLTQPRHLALMLNDSYDSALILSANPPHTPPAPKDMAHYYGPGLHQIGIHKKLRSGDKVYLADGAVVEGSFAIEHASNVSITGRGVIAGGRFPHQENFQTVRGLDTKDVLIEGVTFCNAPGWIVSFWGGSRNLTVRNVKMVGNWRYNTDGVQTGTTGLLVENCFMQCNDDNFSLNGECRDVEIRGNVLWNIYNGGVFMLGWGGGPNFMLRNLDIHDNVILRAGGCCEHDRKAPFSMKVLAARGAVENVRFRDIVVEDVARYGRWLDFQAGKASQSTLRDISFENIAVLKTWKVEGELRGGDAQSPLENVTFKNVRIMGKPMTRPQDGGLNLIHTRGVTIDGNPFADAVDSAPTEKE